MTLKNDAKKMLKLIAKHQSQGVRKGDACPRCGLPTMGANSMLLKSEKIWVCKNCGLEMSLNYFFGEEDYSKWHITESDDGTLTPKKTIRTEIIPKFEVGDQVVDDAGNWSGVVVERLPDGLYSVVYAGETDVQIMKDRELRFDVEDLYVVPERIHIGDRVEIYKSIEIKSVYLPVKGTVVHLTASFCLDVDLGESVETLYPDADCFSLIAEREFDKFEKIQKDTPEIVIEF